METKIINLKKFGAAAIVAGLIINPALFVKVKAEGLPTTDASGQKTAPGVLIKVIVANPSQQIIAASLIGSNSPGECKPQKASGDYTGKSSSFEQVNFVQDQIHVNLNQPTDCFSFGKELFVKNFQPDYFTGKQAPYNLAVKPFVSGFNEIKVLPPRVALSAPSFYPAQASGVGLAVLIVPMIFLLAFIIPEKKKFIKPKSPQQSGFEYHPRLSELNMLKC